jgi:hypothetical protein
MNWKIIDRPGYAGRKKHKLREMYDNTYGPENWRIAWQWRDDLIDNVLAYQIYEDGYYHDSFVREELWRELISAASEVYDIEEADVASGLDYLIQDGSATHLQDIAIRRVVFRRGWQFEGDELVQIRSHKDYFGKNLSPGKVSFHRLEQIVIPHLKGWWNENSIEDWYQSNKVLQIKE